MRSHDHPSRRASGKALFRLILIAAVSPSAASAQKAPEAPGAPKGADQDIDLAAREVRTWVDGTTHWMVLSGRASVRQGEEGLRARDVVVRIVAGSERGAPKYELDIYAEGDVRWLGRDDKPRSAVRTSFRTRGELKLRTDQPEGASPLKAPPPGLAVLDRARTSFSSPRLASAPKAAAEASKPAPRDSAVGRAQGALDGPVVPPLPAAEPPGVDLPPIEGAPAPNLEGPAVEAPIPLPLPGPDNRPAPPLRPDRPPPRAAAPAPLPTAPVMAGTQRVTKVYPRNAGPDFQVEKLKSQDGVSIFLIRGGVNVVGETPGMGLIDLSADSVVIWRDSEPLIGPNGENVDSPDSPMEVYLEGNVVVYQDGRKQAGKADQKTLRANQAFYDFRTDRLISLDSQVDLFAPNLIAPLKVTAPRIEQFRPLEYGPDGKLALGPQQIRADESVMTGSRFPHPGYRITNKSIDLTKRVVPTADPNSGRTVAANPRAPDAPREEIWHYDARQNFFFIGPVPAFYWPKFVGDADDFEPVLRQFAFRTNNYFGQQALADFNGFKVLGIRKPQWIDNFNLDVDYLSARTKEFPALGGEIGWFGKDLLNDLSDPYRRNVGAEPSVTRDYFGFFDVWGLRDFGNDVLGSGPAIITNNLRAGKAGFQRGGGGPKGSVPAFQDFRGRLSFRHMQYFLDEADHPYEDLRVQAELGYFTDRYFLEEYYKRLFEVGLDQETVGYMIRQKDNWAYTVWAEGNLTPWYTDTQWLPKLDYYRIGDSLLGDRLTYYGHTGADYAKTLTATEVNNPNIFAFMPYDPISNTSGVFQTGRLYTSHELDMPLNFDVLRLTPYVQGQAVAWNNQLAGNSVGRVWGAAGVRADVMMWRTFPEVESELFNVHGLTHKINFDADFRDAASNVKLNTLGVQDDLDDNTQEAVRRYFALTNYAGGVLPAQYDPRHLILRRALSPITGTTDVQASIETLQLGIHQRLQTKRGPVGKRRIIDYMTLDLSSTYFPNASRDNFGKPFGQNMYNWQYFIGDRASLVSYGWFEFFDIKGLPIFKTNPSFHNDPLGLNVITSGLSISRPPRGNLFIGYTVLDTGPITTSALNASISYWLSPKWYGTFSDMYDFGNGILLASSFSLTRIGADWLTSVGLVVDPQRQSFMAAIQIAPRLSPNLRFGSGTGTNQFDTRYAPTQ